MKQIFTLMANYNQWMNSNLYEVASSLSQEELNRDRSAFFGSITGTLNHILVGDTIWLKRFATHEAAFPALQHLHKVEKPPTLDTILYPDFARLQAARQDLDKVILEFALQLTDEALVSTFRYTNMKGQSGSKRFADVLMHFFNHQTHHRGQVTTMLSQAGVEPGVTDLLAIIPEVAGQG